MPGIEKIEVRTGKVRRSAWIHVPKQYDPKTDTPVILAFHGGHGTGRVFSEKWQGQFDQGVILVFPNAHDVTERRWVVPTDPEGRYPIPSDADVKFVQALVEHLQKEYNVSGFFATGFSSGAKMTWELFLNHGDKIQGFCPVSRPIPMHMADLSPKSLQPVMMVWGNKDPNSGGSNNLTYKDTAQRLFDWAGLNPETAEFDRDNLSGCSGIKVHRRLYSGQLAFQKREGGGHEWDECHSYSTSGQVVKFFHHFCGM